MGLSDLLQQLTGIGGNPADHFDRVAQQASPDELGRGVAAAMRSDDTPSFSSMIGQTFGQASPTQQAGLLNQILASVGPAALSGLAGGALGRLLRPGTTQVTPEQASQLSPAPIEMVFVS